jgi:hypothetical protein
MLQQASTAEAEERAMRVQILAFLEEHCGRLTLQDVREWYVDAFPETPTAPIAEGVYLNTP